MKPTAKYVPSGVSPVTPEEVRGMICNPIYSGLGQYPQQVDDEKWIAANVRLLNEIGPNQYLVNLLSVLRETPGIGVRISDN